MFNRRNPSAKHQSIKCHVFQNIRNARIQIATNELIIGHLNNHRACYDYSNNRYYISCKTQRNDVVMMKKTIVECHYI